MATHCISRAAAALAFAWGASAFAQTDLCDTGKFALRADFPGARANACEVLDADEVHIAIRPEDSGRINPSPWYGFHVRRHVGAADGPLAVRLSYGRHKHRYVPKISSNGV